MKFRTFFKKFLPSCIQKRLKPATTKKMKKTYGESEIAIIENILMDCTQKLRNQAEGVKAELLQHIHICPKENFIKMLDLLNE